MKFKIKVMPCSDKDEVVKSKDDFIVYVKDKAENNKANLKVIKLLSRYFDVDYKKIKLKGLSSRNKYVVIE